MEYRMNSITAYIPLLLHGATITIGAWMVTSIGSVVIGTVLGILSCNYISSPWSSRLIRAYTFVAKGIPAYVQILIAYFVLPSLLGIHVSGFVAACGALAFCSSGYTTEIIRAGINTVALGQWDACFVLGYPLRATLYRVIMPQTITNILPALMGEFEQLLKSTSLLATIGITELTRSGLNIISRELNPIPVYLIIATIYLLFSAGIHITTFYLEKRIYGYRS